MDQKILDAFYKEILPQANSKNMVSIGGFYSMHLFVYLLK